MMKSYPNCVQIETINNCNARCWFCPLKDLPKRAKMSSKDFHYIIDQLIDNPPNIIYPFLNGEPFLDNRMIKFLKKINDKLPNTEIIIFSNGSLLDESLSKQLLDIVNLRQLWFSLNGIDEDYDKIMGLEYSNTKDNVLKFLKLRDDSTNNVEVNISFVGRNFQDQVKIFEYWTKHHIRLPVTIIFSPIKNYAGLISNHPDTDRRLNYPCTRVFDYLTILANGETALCCMDPKGQVSFGNILDKSIEDIWNSEKRQYYYNMHKTRRWNELDLCKDCTGA
jgi:radical SAM protein with 4Fe4S-binding SPASM domain